MSEPATHEWATDVAIIGSGPAGLGAAVELRRRGVERVTVLERENAAGGTPRHCGHPPFGLLEFGRILTGPAYAGRMVERAQQAGVEILSRHSVVRLAPGGLLRVATPGGPVNIQARRVVLATGARETPPSARLFSGDRPWGCLTTGALQTFVYLHGLVPFRRPVILGTELISLSAIWTCRRAGIHPEAMLEPNRRPGVPLPFTLFPRLLGIPVHYGAEILGVHGRSRVETVSVRLSGGEERKIACDGLLCTGQFIPEAALAQISHLAIDGDSHGPSLDPYGRCSDPAYFAAGNVVGGIKSAGRSWADGVRIGRAIAEDLTTSTSRKAKCA